MAPRLLTPNFLVLALSALIPLIVGFIWYSEALFGKAWRQARFVTEDKEVSLVKTLLVTYLYSFMIALILQSAVIHQFHLHSILANEPGIKDKGSDIYAYYADFMSKYGDRFRTFKHGAFHGVLMAILMAIPVAGINSLHEGRGLKYILINGGFWLLSFMLMGGVICQFT